MCNYAVFVLDPSRHARFADVRDNGWNMNLRSRVLHFPVGGNFILREPHDRTALDFNEECTTCKTAWLFDASQQMCALTHIHIIKKQLRSTKMRYGVKVEDR